MSKPEQAVIPEGCNFIGWFDSKRTPEQLAQMFETEGWYTQAVGCGYTLNRVIHIKARRGGHVVRSYQETLALLTSAPSVGNVLSVSGQVEHPDWMAREIRELLWRLDGQSNTLVCLLRSKAFGGLVWQEEPATAELLGLNPNSLSDADRMAIRPGYLSQPLSDAWRAVGSAWQRRYRWEQWELPGVYFLFESVVVDDERITHYRFGGVHRLEWHMVREVGAAGPDSGYSNEPLVFITGETESLFIKQGCQGFATLLVRLAKLPEFPSEKFLISLNSEMWFGEVAAWNRPVVEPGVAPDSASRDI